MRAGRDRAPRPNRAGPGSPRGLPSRARLRTPPGLRQQAPAPGPAPGPPRAGRRTGPGPRYRYRPPPPPGSVPGPAPALSLSPDDVTPARRRAGAAGSCSARPRRRAHARREMAAGRPLPARRPRPVLGKRRARSAEASGFLRVRQRRVAEGGSGVGAGPACPPTACGSGALPTATPSPCPPGGSPLPGPRRARTWPNSLGRASTGGREQLGMELDPLRPLPITCRSTGTPVAPRPLALARRRAPPDSTAAGQASRTAPSRTTSWPRN